jgi:hypothetical protein
MSSPYHFLLPQPHTAGAKLDLVLVALWLFHMLKVFEPCCIGVIPAVRRMGNKVKVMKGARSSLPKGPRSRVTAMGCLYRSSSMIFQQGNIEARTEGRSNRGTIQFMHMLEVFKPCCI